MKNNAKPGNPPRRKPTGITRLGKLHELMLIAEKDGLLQGKRTTVTGGRMPIALVEQAKKRTGIDSDTPLIEVALAAVAVADDYADWLLSRRGTIDREAELAF
jgi:hypothetical protein